MIVFVEHLSRMQTNTSYRLYLQDDDDAIIEWINEGKGWKKYAFHRLSAPFPD